MFACWLFLYVLFIRLLGHVIVGLVDFGRFGGVLGLLVCGLYVL